MRKTFGEDITATGTLPSNVTPFIRRISISELSQKHNKFKDLSNRINSNSNLQEKLKAASTWVSDNFYADAPDSLKKRRIIAGLSQKQLAMILETSQPQIAKIEAGKTDMHYSTCKKLCEALKISPNELFSIVDSQKSSG